MHTMSCPLSSKYVKLYDGHLLPLLLQEFPWHPKPVNELTGGTAAEINDFPSLIWFTGLCGVCRGLLSSLHHPPPSPLPHLSSSITPLITILPSSPLSLHHPSPFLTSLPSSPLSLHHLSPSITSLPSSPLSLPHPSPSITLLQMVSLKTWKRPRQFCTQLQRST